MTHPDDLLVISSDGSRLVVSGEIDAHTAPSLAAAIDAAGDSVTLDLAGVEFVDSSGLRVLIDAHQRLAEQDGSLTIASPSEAVTRLFEISGVDDYLSIETG
jgi:anti-sigma B factor antagonist